MSLELLVFDCDGIILESVDAKVRAFGLVGAEFGQEAADRLMLYHKMHLGVSRSEKFAWLFREYLKRDITPAENAGLCSSFARHCLDEVIASPLVPGIQEVLDRWQGRLPMYVASGTPEAELRCILEHRGLDGYFDGIRGYPPGKHALLKEIIVAAKASPSETLMIGDGSTDMQAAEEAGCLFYGRGEAFENSGHPWHADMTCLNAYIASVLRQDPAI